MLFRLLVRATHALLIELHLPVKACFIVSCAEKCLCTGSFLIACSLQIPYWIVINTSVFTDEANKRNHEFGVKVRTAIHARGLAFFSYIC